MICPILNMNRINQNAQCVKENCAWWDKSSEQCAIISLAANVDFVADMLQK